jgi:hypothetical protein
MKNMTKTPKARTIQWKFSDFDEQEREEAALSSLLRKKKALTAKNVELEIEALIEAETKVNPREFKETDPRLPVGQQIAGAKQSASPRTKKKKVTKKAAATTKSPKAFAKKALYDAKSTFKEAKKAKKVVRKASDFESTQRAPLGLRSATETKKITKRAALKARNDRYTVAEKEKKTSKSYSDRHTTRPSSRAKKTNANFKDTKMKREIIAKPLTQEERVKKLKKRVAMKRNPPSYH